MGEGLPRSRSQRRARVDGAYEYQGELTGGETDKQDRPNHKKP